MKKLTITILILLAAVLAGCFGGSQGNENVNTNVNEIDTSSWKTYKSEEYGFEIEYPKDWDFTESFNTLVGPYYYVLELSIVKKGVTQGEDTEFYDGAIFRISLTEVDNELSLRQWTESNNLDNFSEISFLDFKALQIVKKFQYGEEIIDNSEMNNIYFKKDSIIYQTSLFSVGPDYRDYSLELNKILETLKFSK